jgi:hypothetical protein
VKTVRLQRERQRQNLSKSQKTPQTRRKKAVLKAQTSQRQRVPSFGKKLPFFRLSLPDPRTTGVVGGYYIAPSMPIWRADIPISNFAPKVEYPDLLTKMPRVVKWEDDEKVSKAIPWNDSDFKRLNINLRIPIAASPEPKIELKEDRRGEKPLLDDFDF